jgi:cell division protein FtsW (lipid II flippase)
MKFLHLLTRILSLAFVLFLSLFALDVFSEYSGWGAILPLLIHLVPPLILLTLSLIAWKYDLVGAVVFLGFAILYVFLAGFNRPWSWYAGISLPSALVGGLFILSWYQKRPK